MTVPANLFVVGAAKAGTSTLHDTLDLHPDIFMSDPKEPHYFSHRWREAPEAYAALFADGADCRYRGESSTGYAVFPDVPERIRADTVDPRILLTLRNPVDRAWSHYWWLRLMGQETREFEEAFEASIGRPSLPEDRIRGTGNYANYHDAGRYGFIVGRYAEVFGTEAMWMCDLADLAAEPQATMNGCFAFLGLDPLDPLPAIHSNQTAAVRFPKLTRAVELLGTSPRAKRLGRWLPGARAAKTAALRVLRRKGAPTGYPRTEPILRARVADTYRDDIVVLRQLWPAARSCWLDDFPLPPGDPDGPA